MWFIAKSVFFTFIASKSLKLSCALNCVLMHANNIKRISNWLILVFEVRKKFEAISHQKKLFPNPSDTQWRYDKHLTNLVLSVRTVTYQSAFSPLIYGLCHKLMGQNLVHNLQYGPPTQLVRDICLLPQKFSYSCVTKKNFSFLLLSRHVTQIIFPVCL